MQPICVSVCVCVHFYVYTVYVVNTYSVGMWYVHVCTVMCAYVVCGVKIMYL